MLKLIRVSGNSLYPEYQSGDFVFIGRIPWLLDRLRPGDTVAFRHPELDLMIKKVEAISADGTQLTVIGTHPLSRDSRHFGPIPREQLVGKVLFHVRG